MRRSAAITAFAVTLGLLTACTPEVKETPTPTPDVSSTAPEPSPAVTGTPTTAVPEPSPSPSPSETLDADQLAAQEVVREFFRLSDELAQNPELPLQPLADITTGQTQDLYLAELVKFREMNAVQVGNTALMVSEVGLVTDSDSQKIVAVEACTDSSGADLVDRESGNSILPPDRNPHVSWIINVVAVNTHWLVGDISNEPVEGCPA